VGAGLFVDNEVGAATATGVGEEMVRMCGSHTIVELMRQGYTPDEACKQAIERVIRKHGEAKARSLQVGFLALRKDGRYGAASVVKGFNYAYRSQDGEKVFDAKPVLHG
jgi:isoaspartyl peptidase/L-asparaginase-like protein (Ntn-hydrolase superfamily)